MSATQPINVPEAFDRHRRLLGLAMLAMAIVYGAKAVEFLVGQDVGRYLDYLRAAMAISALSLLLPVAYWKLTKLPRGQRSLYFSADGFVENALNRATKASWAVTFLLLMFVDAVVLDADRPTTLPAEFFVATAIAVMLGVASLSFFYLNRSGGDDDIEDEARA